MARETKPRPTRQANGGAAVATAAQVCLGKGLPFRLELVPNPATANEPGQDPFVILSDEPGRARVYLGKLTAGEGSIVRWLAIKLMPPAGEPSGLEGQVLSDAQRRRRFEREWSNYQALRKSAGEGDGAPAIVPTIYFVQPPDARGGIAEQPIEWPALVYCRASGSLIPLRTRGGARLEVCRDEQALAEAGLPGLAGGPLFLWDPLARAGGQAPVFYQIPGDASADGNGAGPRYPGAKSLEDLLGEIAELNADPIAALDLGGPEALDRLAELVSEQPVFTHPAARGALAERKAELYQPWLLAGSPVLALELCTFHYDEFSDILGGISEEQFRQRYCGPAAATGQRMRLEQGLAPEVFQRPLLFAHDASGLDALEIFRLKWALFAQLCLAAREFHRRCAAPHLRLAPSHVMVNLLPGGAYLPSLWRFETRLVSLGSPIVQLPGHDPMPEIFTPPVGADPLYQAEIVRNSSFGIVQRGEFLLSAIEDAPGGKAVLVAQLRHEGIALRWLSPRDHLMLNLPRHLVAEAEIEFLARRDESKDYSSRVIHLRSLPLELTAAKRAALTRLRAVPVPNAQFRLLPALHVPADLHSLGMLLLRVLLVNDAQGLGDVSLALEELRHDMANLTSVECEQGMEASFWDALLAGHRRAEVREVFDRRQIFYSELQRERERPNAIPRALWNEALAIAMQLVTQVEGFSFCADHGDFEETVPAARVEALLARVNQLSRRIDSALFALTPRNAEVRFAIERVMQETMSA